ncbi:cilia- and flagella-associated protein 157 [Anableps anableps]
MADKTSLENEDRSLFLVQIRYLEEELERYQLTCEELKKQNQELLSHQNELEKEKKDKTERLKRYVAAKEKRMDELREELVTQIRTAEQSRESLRLEHIWMKQQLQEQIDELQSEIELEAVALKENEERIMELKQEVPEIRSVEKEVLKKKAEYDAIIQRLKKNTELQCEMLIQQFQDYNEHTENADASKFLAMGRALYKEHSEVMLLLVNEKSSLKEEISALLRRQDHIRSVGRGLCRKLTHLDHLRNLNEKDVKLLKKAFLELKEEKEECIRNQEVTLTETEALSQQVSRTHEEYQQIVADVERLEEELERETVRRRQLEGVKEEAAIILRYILEGLEDVSEAQWKIRRLVEILDKAAPQNTKSTSKSFRKKARGRKWYTTNPNSVRHKNLPGSVNPSDPTPLQSQTGTKSTGQQ